MEQRDKAIIRVFEAILKVYMPKHAKQAEDIFEYARESLDSWRLVGIIKGYEDPDFARAKLSDEDVKPSFIADEYVYQYKNGGYSGDSYSGYTFLRLDRHHFIKFHYDM